ncbi:hypothetical protein Bca4012_020436 [Brassica carinata]
MTSVRDYMREAVLCVTCGPEQVAKYQFVCLSPYTVGDKTFLQEGVTEEQHWEAIKELVGGHPIVCSKHMLKIMFNKPQLLIVFRVALEIEMVYAKACDDGTEDGVDYPRFTVDYVIDMQRVLYGELMTIEELDRAFPNFQGPPNIHHSTSLEVQPLGELPTLPPVWEDMTAEEAYWNGMMEEDASYEVYINQSSHPTHGALGLPIGPNRRISTAPRHTIIVINDDYNDDASYTGSSDGINENENINRLTPTLPKTPTHAEENNNAATIEKNNAVEFCIHERLLERLSKQYVHLLQMSKLVEPLFPTPVLPNCVLISQLELEPQVTSEEQNLCLTLTTHLLRLRTSMVAFIPSFQSLK